MTVRAFLGGFRGFEAAGGTGHILLRAARKPLGVSGAYCSACSIRAIQPGVLPVGSFQEQLHSSEVACEYIQYISLLSECQRGGNFAMNVIDCSNDY